ncbi:hypothetical protein HG536_0B03310 [Torulaspora globosa]|uniref:Conserved oligomeric Golgi complex subunit 6 n=1 Tax=Torulaspora globosa TaxID=48254 RepID=A0A7G3ZD82_9SACH|nr:uncharacterized protein HG536_0B03310 [Torulaspora globosa]QLL31468.1 hypothetical protein HG536_0B03310 [Torulaspora globosa]
MDFIDLEAFSVIDSSAEKASDSSLPEPSSLLDLSTLSIDSGTNEASFKIPDLRNREDVSGSGKDNLYDRMAQHASMLMSKVDKRAVDAEATKALRGKTSHFMEPSRTFMTPAELKNLPDKNPSASEVTTDLLLRKLSNILNEHTLTNYQTRTQIRKSLQLLEENKERLQLDESRLIDSGFVGNLARKSMRSGLENELLKEHLLVLEELRPIIRRIKRFSIPVEKIKAAGQSIVDSHGLTSEDDKESVSKDIELLCSQAKRLRLKKSILSSMKDHFTLTQVEDDYLLNGPVDVQFFRIVDKAIKIKEHTVVLLSLPSSTAADALIRRINQVLESVYRKVFNHLIDFLHNYDSGSNSFAQATIPPSKSDRTIFKKSVVCLSNDLKYFNEFLKRVTAMRSKGILDEFLSQFDYNPNESRPILLSAGDPLRYVGDVLASVHASIANEADFVKPLFKFQEDLNIVTMHNKELFDGLDTKVFNEVVRSLANPSRIRIEQVIRFEEDPVINFEIIRLLDLYQLMYHRQGINTNNIVIENLKSLQEISKTRIEDFFTKYLGDIPSVSDKFNDSMPPEWLYGYINKLVELFEAHEQGGDWETKKRSAVINGAFLENFVSNPIDEVLMKRLQQETPLAKKNDEARYSLLSVQINCLDLIKSRLQPFANSILAREEKAVNIWKSIGQKMDDFINRMLDLQFKLLMERCGLGLYYNLLNMIFPIASVQDELDYDMYLSLSDNPLMNLETINDKVNKRLNEYVPQALTDIQDNLMFKLMSPTIADYICDSCLAKLCLFYATFRKVMIHLYPERTEDICNILNFSEEEFKALVGVK